MKRFWALNLTAVAILTAGWIEGSVASVFENDKTYLCYLILGLVCIGLYHCVYRDWDSVNWYGNVSVVLGMIGTVVGFLLALSGVDPEAAGNISQITPMVSQLLSGMATALGTTLVGLVGYLWLSVNARLR